MTTQIVTVNVTQTIAPAPSTLQRTGAFISQGGTTLTPGTSQLLTQLSDLTSILSDSNVITAMTWNTGTVTVTLTDPHGIGNGTTVTGVISGVTPAAYNGTFSVTAASANTLTYALASNPGAAVLTGNSLFELDSTQELLAMGTTYFAQGSSTAVYVLELGIGTAAEGVTELTTYIADPAVQFYAYCTPKTWTGEASFITLAKNNESTTAKLYFFVTTTLSNYAAWSSQSIKSAILVNQDTTAPITEFTAAAFMYKALAYNPSTTNKVAPYAFQFIVGVTAFTGNNTTKQILKTANVNYVGVGVEGGITNTMIQWGVTGDGRDFTYWYSVDWVQINIDLFISNAVINGSNNPINPLYYNQAGINTLQKVAQGVMNSGVSFGLVLPPVTVAAVPFATYVTDNPSDYSIGKYAGLSVAYTPARGFTQIIFNVNVTDFVQV